MKRLLASFLCILIFTASINISTFADSGSGNINGGGGEMGGGSTANFWNNGDDGIRVTIVRASDNKPVAASLDLCNRDESDVVRHFIKKSKLQYRDGAGLSMDSDNYSAIHPPRSLPTVITGTSTNNIAAIKSYFCSEWAARQIASWTGISYDSLIDGTYKLLLEPIAYFTFNGYKMAMTATEAAMYDEALSGGLRAKMVSLSHQNLPLALFLQTPDMGYPAYTGSTSTAQSDSTIISKLGLGIVKYADSGTNPTPPSDSMATYRCDTDVVTTVTLSSDSEINPDHTANVTFNILGGSYTVTDIVIPAGESQLVWCKWHTPSTPQTVDISVSASKGSLNINNIAASIVSVDGHEPPDPTASDRNDTFTTPTVPSPATTTSNSWGVWSGYWVPNWVWHEDWEWHSDKGSKNGGSWEDDGSWVDEGKWNYDFTSYHATLSANMSLMPDSKDPSRQGKEMKSGYGVDITINGDLSSNALASHVTAPQTGLTYFPEFAYKTYWRHLDFTPSDTSAAFQFMPNIYSTYNNRVHFTPLWYPDSKYTAYTYLEDAWTPAGMLSENLTDYVMIKGSCYDDWHIGPKLVN